MTIAKFVTDGSDVWLLRRMYIYYTQKQAIQAFNKYLADNNLKLANIEPEEF